MTLPQNVKDAVKSLECEIADPEDCTAWQTIHTHLLSQEVLIVKLRAENIKLHGWIDGVAQAGGTVQRRLNKAESRLDAADALLRYVSRYLDPRHYAEAIKKIDAHLSENPHDRA